MKKIGIGLATLVALGLLSACGTSAHSTENKKDKLEIVTTFYPMYDFTKNIVGDEANVTVMIPAGSEPHDYEPSAKDMAAVHDADVFVYHNENMETWVPKAQKSFAKEKPHVVAGTKNMVLLPGGDEEHDHDHSEEDHHHELDPHTWVSPYRAIQEVTSIKEQLQKLYPKKAKAFETNAAKYLTELKKLDQTYSESLHNAKQKSFVTQHAAFGYLALDYGLKQVAISGLSPEQEPSASRLGELKEYVKDNGIHYIYFEENASDKIAKTLANEADVKMAVLNPLESLTKEQIANGESYLSVMKENLQALEKTTEVAGKEVKPEAAATEEKTVANGYFANSAVKERQLSDFTGKWQSVYPLLTEGALDQVFDYKAKLNQDMSAAQYKEYYTTGYKTDVEKIDITANTMDFVVNGQHHKYEYVAKGYQILTYDKGNRGVRFLFEAKEDAGRFQYVQFSDHNIAPTKTAHFHIYFGGESQNTLLEEMHNWPTYYPANLSDHAIAQEMMAH